jgi:hypothetical protein
MRCPGVYPPDPTLGISDPQMLPPPKLVSRSRNYEHRPCPLCGNTKPRKSLHPLLRVVPVGQDETVACPPPGISPMLVTLPNNFETWPSPSHRNASGGVSRPSSSPSRDGPPRSSHRAWAAPSARSRTGSPSTTAAASRPSTSGPGPDGRGGSIRSITPGSRNGSRPRRQSRTASVLSGGTTSGGSSRRNSAPR